MPITIWHNQNCGTSRKVLAALQEKGLAPEVVLYLKTPPDAGTIKATLKKMGQPASALVREKEKLFGELGLAGASETTLVAAMVEHPILINRPVVISGDKAALCRPPEVLESLL